LSTARVSFYDSGSALIVPVSLLNLRGVTLEEAESGRRDGAEVRDAGPCSCGCGFGGASGVDGSYSTGACGWAAVLLSKGVGAELGPRVGHGVIRQ
jgi:hypothetical protein